MLELRQWLLAAGLGVSLVAMGCGSDSSEGEGEAEAEAEAEGEDMGVPDETPIVPSNIGDWCDPADSDLDGNNPACEGDATCLTLDNPPENGMCVVVGCNVDLSGTTGINEEDCRINYGSEFTCVDLDGIFSNDGEPYNPPLQPDGKNADLTDNVCVPKCVPSATENPCEDQFACLPSSTRYNFVDTVCLGLACLSGEDCPVSVTDEVCTQPSDCTAPEFCNLLDTNGDGVPDEGVCSLPGNCDTTTGVCKKHTHGDPTAAIGDPCTADIDCPVGGWCITQDESTDDLGVHLVPRNGYCSMLGCRYAAASGITCPAGTACNQFFFAGACFDLCDPSEPAGCRDDPDEDGDGTGNGVPCDVIGGVVTDCDWGGDYECWDWGGWSFFGGAVPVVAGSDGMICDYSGPVNNDCEGIAASSGNQGCPSVAPTGNPNGMDCYNPETGVPTASNVDPLGRCLDVTTSGDFCGDYGSFNTSGVCVP